MNSLTFYQNELKERPLMVSLLAQAGIEVPHSRLIRAPAHIYEDHNPSIYVYPDHLVDYGDSNTGYDLLKVAREWLGLQLDQAVALLADLAGLTAPVPFRGQVRQAEYRTLPGTARTDPNEYAIMATRCEEALLSPQTMAAEAALRYLESRQILTAARFYRVGVADSTVSARLPSSIWRNMLTFPTWHDGQLIALKGRNLLGKGEGREMRNLGGTGTAPYGLRELAGSTGAVLVVEGETDALSTWAAFGGEVNVIGIPGASHWKRLQHPALEGRRVFLCLDVDEAGQKAVRDAQVWAADAGRALHIMPNIGDKNQILMQSGSAELRHLLSHGARKAQHSAARRLV